MCKRLSSLVLLLAMTAAACGTGTSDAGLATIDEPDGSDAAIASLDGSDGSATADAAVEMEAEEAMFALAECLRDQGLDVEDPEVGDDGNMRLGSLFRPLMQSGEIDRETIGVAMAACEDISQLITTEFHQDDRTEMDDQLYAYAACMRDNGYDMPDPDFGDSEAGMGQGKGNVFGDIDRQDPEFQEANASCSDIFIGSGLGDGAGGGA